MSEDDNILNPWYEHPYNYDYGQMNRELEWENPEPPPKIDPKWEEPSPYVEKVQEPTHREIVDKHPLDSRMYPNDVRTRTLAEMTVAARLALRSGKPISIRENLLMDSYGPWFEKQKTRGLKDVALVADFVVTDKEKVLGEEDVAMISWYNDGSISRMTVSYDMKTEKLVMHETPLEIGEFEKPEFPDNGPEFHEALLDIASVAPNQFWYDYFMKAVRILESDNFEYDKQPDTFYLPQPYFKYVVAVFESYIGGGMGSWNDTPIAGTREFRLVNAELHYQKCRALLYAVNNC